YARFTEATEQTVTVTGAGQLHNQGGVVPLAVYLDALQGRRGEQGLNAKYLSILRRALEDPKPSLLLNPLRAKFREKALTVAEIEAWQRSLWRFTSVGHIGKENGPKAWQEAVNPLREEHEARLKLTAPADGGDLILYLVTSDAGDGTEHDAAVWENPRLVAPGRPDLPVRQLPAVLSALENRRKAVASSAAACLAAAHEADAAKERPDLKSLAAKHGVDLEILGGWLDWLGIGAAGEASTGSPLTQKLERTPDYDFIQGWKGEQALGVLANSSDATVRIPGAMRGRSVATHPSPTQASVISWRSPVAGSATISGKVQDVHPECGNGVTWALEVRRGTTREVLASGVTKAAEIIDIGTHEAVRVRPGDAVAMVVGPRDGNHVCDLTAVDLVIREGESEWDLAADVSPDILAGNPHADRLGHETVWHFGSEPAEVESTPEIPADSLLAQWRRAATPEERAELAGKIQRLLERDADTEAPDSPDRALRRQLLSANGRLLGAALRSAIPNGAEVNYDVNAPDVIEFRLPAELAEGAEFVAKVRLRDPEGSVQMRATVSRPDGLQGVAAGKAESALQKGQWSDNNLRTEHSDPVLAREGGAAWRRFEAAFDEFRALFPMALCYTRIVPVDEVVTLTLFHREDEPLKRLMLDEAEVAEIDRLWEELRIVSEAPLKQVDVFEQLFQF
ncbi:MAG: hypothetical protein KDM63_16060, partial [Verrucomicrobiae bacterium]|nr:hypothetical protein [Verrucomicrobiae bacterium]